MAIPHSGRFTLYSNPLLPLRSLIFVAHFDTYEKLLSLSLVLDNTSVSWIYTADLRQSILCRDVVGQSAA